MRAAASLGASRNPPGSAAWFTFTGLCSAEDLRAGKMTKAADLIEQAIDVTLTYYAFPDLHLQKIRTNNPLERQRRTRVFRAF